MAVATAVAPFQDQPSDALEEFNKIQMPGHLHWDAESVGLGGLYQGEQNGQGSWPLCEKGTLAKRSST